MGVSQDWGYLFGVPMIRIIVFWVLFWVIYDTLPKGGYIGDYIRSIIGFIKGCQECRL